MLYYVFTLIAIFIFLFEFWRHLKEDYSSDNIFSLSFIILLTLFISSVVAKLYFVHLTFWANLISLLFILFVGTKRYHLRFFEVFEASTIALLPWVGLTYLNQALLPFNVKSLFLSIFIVILMLLFNIFKNNYKKFTWYRSGKIGFSALSVLILFFLMKTAVAIFWPSMVSFAQEAFIAGGFTVFCFITLMILKNE